MTITITSVSKSAKRTLASPLTRTAVKTIAAAWHAGPDGITLAQNELKNVKAQTPVYAFDTMGREFGYCTVSIERKNDLSVFDKLTAVIGILTANAGAVVLHTGDEDEPEAAEDDVNETLRVQFSCKIGADTFQHTFNKKYTLLSGYENDTTRESVETWADAQEVLA